METSLDLNAVNDLIKLSSLEKDKEFSPISDTLAAQKKVTVSINWLVSLTKDLMNKVNVQSDLMTDLMKKLATKEDLVNELEKK